MRNSFRVNVLALESLYTPCYCSIVALQPTSQNCQTVNNVSVYTSGLLTGSRNQRCSADTWILMAQPGQHIELVIRHYTSRGVANSTNAADDDGVGNDRKSR